MNKEGMMKIRKFLIMLIGVFAIVGMLVSCTSYKRPGFTYPFPSTRAPQIATTMVEVTVNPEIGRGKLKIQFDPITGKCLYIVVNDEEKILCDDERFKEFAIPLEKTYFCTRPDDNHPPNTQINNVDVYCGNVKFLTDGADIRFKADSTAGNYECHNSGGYAICY